METEMESTSETADNETANDPEAAKSHEFRVNVSAIESVAKDQQASELQSLELEVFDHATLEKGIIAQVNEAIEAAEPSKVQSTKAAAFEDGEIQDVVGPEDDEEEDDFSRRIRLGEVTPFEQSKEGKSFQEKAKNGYNEILERYMASQAGMENARRKMVNRHPSNKQPPAKLSPNKRQKKPKEFVPEVEEQKAAKEKTKRDLKSKFVGAKTRKKAIKEKLGTRRARGAARCDTAAQPGEENVMNVNNTSGSEYLPSESDDSGVHPSKARKRVFKPLKSMMTKITSRDDSESDWESSDEELTKKRRGNKELDDGDPHYFTKRVKVINQDDYLKEAHFVMDEFKCPKIVWDKLYKYQQVAVKWFWELNQQRCGGILGDEMGLGKTIQVIAFLSGLYVSDIYDYDTGFKGLGPTLVVCPTTVMHQWVREFHAWFPILRVAILHESGTFSNTGKERTRLIDSIHSHDYGVLITSYTGLVKHSKKMLEKQWHYVILDEGHKIRNNQAQVTVVAKQLETPHRIILSGSPLQNNLKELWSLFDFIFPGKLGTLQVFTNVFHLPIVAGGYTNASPSQVMQAYKCAVTLKDTITPYLLRRMKCDVDAHIKLPPKTEQVLFCNLTNEQKDMYKNYLKDVNIEDMVKGDAKVFVGLINLRKICNHPDLYSGGPSSDFTIRGSSEAPDEDRFGHWERAGKMIVVRTLLKIWHQQKHRVLLFTQTQKMLLILEDFVKRCSYKYLKLDGNTSVAARQPLIDKFNKDTSHFIMLLTTKVGGLGVNLTGANRVVIYDPDWNPATDTQARERAWRIGQERDVTVYRLITAGTIEEKIYHRQIFKQFLSNKVLKDPKQRRFFKSNDLSELFTFSETVKNGTNETAAIFAGTGSEVKLSKMTAKKKARFSAKEAAQDPKITFSESKIEGMKRIAHMLSQKMMIKVKSALNCKESAASTSQNVDSIQNSKGSVLVTDVYGPDGKLISENVQKLNEDSSGHIGEDMRSQLDKNEPENSSGTKLLTDENDNHAKIASKKRSAPSEEVGPRRRKKKKRDKKEKGKFEGHVVPHLVRCKSVKNNRNEELQAAATQDDYVLSKLFSKTGIETALRHDTIMEGGPHDYAIIEAEADRVAHEAIKALKESSAQVPVVRKPLLKPTAQGSALLNAIRKRNMVVDASDSENQLVRNLVSYLSSNGGVASTDKIIAEFSSKVDPNKSPVFKSLLGKIATFHRGSDKIGYWTLKDEFKLQLDS